MSDAATDIITQSSSEAACASGPSVGRDAPAAAMDGAQRQRRVRRARKSVAKGLAKLERLAQAGPRHRARQYLRVFLASYDTKLVALHDANQRLRKPDRVPQERLFQEAEVMNLWRASGEPVTVHARPKSSGDGYRPIMVFGLVEMARKLMARQALERVVQLRDQQFAARGRGRDAACTAVKRALEEGYRWALTIDIQGCFGSFNERELSKRLPVARKVTETVIVSRSLNIHPGHIGRSSGPVSLLMEGRRGIPQGSPASQLVAEVLLSPLLICVRGTARIVNYADNFAILARTRREAEQTVQTLLAVATRLSVGPLTLKRQTARRTDHGFEFLGYRFRRRRGVTIVSATKSNVRRFARRCATIVRERPPVQAAIELRARARSWRQGFRLWDFAPLAGRIVSDQMKMRALTPSAGKRRGSRTLGPHPEWVARARAAAAQRVGARC